jgi:hypothetical protein
MPMRIHQRAGTEVACPDTTGCRSVFLFRSRGSGNGNVLQAGRARVRDTMSSILSNYFNPSDPTRSCGILSLYQKLAPEVNEKYFS